jgi:biopolymer transport protein ExbD
MTETGRIQLDQEELSLETLAARMRGRLDGQPQTPVILRADQSAEHGKVVAVMDQLKIAGVQKLAIATQQKQR